MSVIPKLHENPYKKLDTDEYDQPVERPYSTHEKSGLIAGVLAFVALSPFLIHANGGNFKKDLKNTKNLPTRIAHVGERGPNR